MTEMNYFGVYFVYFKNLNLSLWLLSNT